MMQLLAVGCGGFLGAITRFLLSGYLQRRADGGFPIGTLGVNVLGCFLIGLLMTVVHERQMFSEGTRLLLGAGFLGSLTTFSTFGMESIQLLRAGDMRLFLASVAGNVLLGLLAVVAGVAAARGWGS